MKLRHRLKSILGVGEPPHRVAVSFSMGVFLGMSPLIGLHTVLALLVAWIFKLNRFVAITGVYITNPWTIVPIYAFSTWVGTLLTGTGHLVPEVEWGSLTAKSLLNELRPLLWPFVLGTTVVGAVSGVFSYFLIRKAMERTKRDKNLPKG